MDSNMIKIFTERLNATLSHTVLIILALCLLSPNLQNRDSLWRQQVWSPYIFKPACPCAKIFP